MKNILTAILTPCVAVASNAYSQEGFDSASVRAFLENRMIEVPEHQPASPVDDVQMLILGAEVGLFRDGAVVGATAEAMADLPQVMPGSLRAFQGGEISSRYPYIWPYVMAGSFIVIGNSLGDDPIAAFYNPYFDVAILTRWQFMDETESETGPGFKIVQAVPTTGRAFLAGRDSLPTDTPVWSDSKAIFEVRIVEAAQKFVSAFEKRYPPFGRESVALSESGVGGAVKLVEDRVFTLLRWVIDAQNPVAPVNYAREISELRGALSSSFPARLEKILPAANPQNADVFFRLGEGIRSGMKPYLVVERNVIFIDPINLPTCFVSVHYEAAGRGYSVGTMALFNMEARYPLE